MWISKKKLTQKLASQYALGLKDGKSYVYRYAYEEASILATKFLYASNKK